MKKLFVVLLASLVLLTFGSAMALAGDVVRIVVDGQELQPDVPPQIVQDRTLIPIRFVAEALGADVDWEDATKTAIGKKGEVEIKLAIGGAALKKGVPTEIDVPAAIIGDRTMVPLRFVSENLGAQVDWDDATRTVTVLSANPDPGTPPTENPPATEEPGTGNNAGSDNPATGNNGGSGSNPATGGSSGGSNSGGSSGGSAVQDKTANASVEIGALNFKEITLKSTNVTGAAKFQVEGTTTVQAVGETIRILDPHATVRVSILAANGTTVLASGDLNISETKANITFDLN